MSGIVMQLTVSLSRIDPPTFWVQVSLFHGEQKQGKLQNFRKPWKKCTVWCILHYHAVCQAFPTWSSISYKSL